MDHLIYGRTTADFGKYATRRHPKGGGGAVDPVTGKNGVSLVARQYSVSGLGNVSPLQTVWEYVVPPGKQCRVEQASALWALQVVGAGKFQSLSIFLQRGDSRVDIARVVSNVNSLNDGQQAEKSVTPFVMYEGERLFAQVNTGGGGAQLIHLTFAGIEYNASDPVSATDSARIAGSYEFAAPSTATPTTTTTTTTSQPKVGYLGTGGLNSGTPIV